MKEVVQKEKRNPGKRLNGKEIESKDSYAILDPNTLLSDSNTGTELSEIDENLVIHYVDDVNKFEEVPQDLKANLMMSKGNIDDEGESGRGGCGDGGGWVGRVFFFSLRKRVRLRRR
ncbi:unnamed protein product [Prunus armeniaca]